MTGEAENRCLADPTNNLTPDKIFEQRWATNLLERVLGRLRQDFSVESKGDLFEERKQCLWGDKGPASYQEIATRLGMTEGAVKVAVPRLRQRYQRKCCGPKSPKPLPVLRR